MRFDACGYWMDGVCTYAKIECSKVPLEKCVSIAETLELAK
mgnify:CR=1 FL=1